MPSHELPVSDRHEELGHAEAGCPSETGERSASLRPGLTELVRRRPLVAFFVRAFVICRRAKYAPRLWTCRRFMNSPVRLTSGSSRNTREPARSGQSSGIRSPRTGSPLAGVVGGGRSHDLGVTRRSLNGRDSGGRGRADHDHRHAEAERDPLGHPEARADPDQDPSDRAAGPG